MDGIDLIPYIYFPVRQEYYPFSYGMRLSALMPKEHNARRGRIPAFAYYLRSVYKLMATRTYCDQVIVRISASRITLRYYMMQVQGLALS